MNVRPEGCTCCFDYIDEFRAALEGVDLDDLPCRVHDPDERARVLAAEEQQIRTEIYRTVLAEQRAEQRATDDAENPPTLAEIVRRGLAEQPAPEHATRSVPSTRRPPRSTSGDPSTNATPSPDRKELPMDEFSRALQTVGIDPPEELAAAEAYEDAVRSFRAGAAGTALKVREAIEQQTVSPADLADLMREAAVDQLVVGQRYAVGTEGDFGIRELRYGAMRRRGDEWLRELQPRWASAGATLAASVERPDPDEPPVSVSSPECDVALRELAAIRNVRTLLARCGYGERDERASWYVRRFETLKQRSEADEILHGAHHGLVALAEAGYALRLNLASESAAIEAAVARKVPRDLLPGMQRSTRSTPIG